MKDGLNRGWKQEGRFSGNYGMYQVQGFKYIDPAGEIGWHTTSWPMRNPIHNFWVADNKFFKFAVHPAESILHRQPIEIAEEAVNINPNEREAVLIAIKDWESPDPKWTDWSIFDQSDFATHPKDKSTVEIKLATGRIVEGFFTGALFGAVGHQNFILEEEQNAEKRWRYSPKHV